MVGKMSGKLARVSAGSQGIYIDMYIYIYSPLSLAVFCAALVGASILPLWLFSLASVWVMFVFFCNSYGVLRIALALACRLKCFSTHHPEVDSSDSREPLRFIYWIQVRWCQTHEIVWTSCACGSHGQAERLLYEIRNFCDAIGIRRLLQRSVYF